jgi:hypothetical protein
MLQVIIQGVLTAALPIVVGFAMGWLRAKTNEIMGGVDAQTGWLVESAVSAAVQSGIAGRIRNRGQARQRDSYGQERNRRASTA